MNGSIPADQRQLFLIEARIYSRSGMVSKALEIYERLRDAYPADRDIQEAYIEFLVDQRYYERAQYELSELLGEDPANLRGQRLQARLYYEQAQYGWTFAIYDKLLQTDQNDAGVWSDYASARQNNTQWSDALNYYSRVLELDTDNRDARQAVHEILRTHGPRLDLGHRRYEQIADNTTIDTLSVGLGQHLSDATRFFVDYRHLNVNRPEQPFARAVDGYFNDILVRLQRQFNQRWSTTAGIGGYSGESNRTSYVLGGGFTPAPGISLEAEYQANRPWYDPVDAVELGGAYNRFRFSFDYNDGKRTGILLQGEDWRYSLDGAGDYGQQRTVLGMLTLRILPAPELIVGYSYYRSWFDYTDSQYRPVAMVEDQGWHSIFGTLVHHRAYWSWGLSAGFRRDHLRSLNAWFIQPTVKVRMGNRMELNVGYEYSSESTAAVGGETQTLQIAARLYF